MKKFNKSFYKDNQVVKILKPATNDSIFKIVLKENLDIIKLLIEELNNSSSQKIDCFDAIKKDNIYLNDQHSGIVIKNEDTTIIIEIDDSKTKYSLNDLNLLRTQSNKENNEGEKFLQVILDNNKYSIINEESTGRIFVVNGYDKIKKTRLKKARIYLQNIKRFCRNKDVKELSNMERISLMLVEKNKDNLFKLANGKEEYIKLANSIIKANSNPDILNTLSRI